MMRVRPIVWCVLLSWAGTATGRADEFQQHLRAGEAATEAGDSDTAMHELRIAVQLAPQAPEGWYRMGLLLAQEREFQAAAGAFRRAVELKPDFPEADYSLGLTYIADPQAQLDWPSAIAAFRKAVMARPDYAEALNLLGAGLVATGDPEGGVREFERAIQVNPKLAEAHFNLGLALQKKGASEEAGKEYRWAVTARSGGYPEASTALAKLLFAQNQNPAAETELRSALRLNPDLTDAHYALARVLQAEKKVKDASIEFDIANDGSRKKTDAMQSLRLSNQALEAAAAGDRNAALEHLQKALELKPDSGLAHYNFGLLLADAGDFKRAAQELEHAASLLPGQSRPWFELGRVLGVSGDRSGALSALSLALRLAPGDARIAAELQSLKTGTNSGGKDAGPSPVCKPVPDTVAAHLETGKTWQQLGDEWGAAGEFLRVLALAPANMEARFNLARAYLQLDKTDRAKIEIYKLFFVAPQHAGAHDELGRILMREARR